HEQLERETGNHSALIERLGTLEQRYAQLDGYDLEYKAKKILAGLGFRETEFSKPLSAFSGGWRMRVYLARLLLQEPHLLLLDEPTNHLDLPSLEWVENYLRGFSGSMIIVSHDRFFIDRLAQEIVELYRGRLTHYAGNYHFYEKQKALHHDRLIKKIKEQQEERARLERFINRFRYKATKAAQVQSRIKQLEKMETIELPEDFRTISFQIKADVPSYKEVLDVQDLWFRYDSDWVLKAVHLRMYRGEKVALVGVNGAGKTTFTRLISGELKPQKGTLRLGQRVHVGYYSQHQIEALDLSRTIYDEVAATAADSFRDRLRDILGVFHFSGDDILKPIRVLSGGEKARVSLAKILLSPCNFLIMDEPTNHLDLQSKEALEQALQDYDGTLLLISHDRYFLDKLVNRVVEIDRGRLKEYAGNYSDYLARKEAESPRQPQKNEKPAPKKDKEKRRQAAQARQAISKDRQRLKNRIAELEDEIERLEQEKARLEQALADPETYRDGEQSAKLNREYKEILALLPQKETEWEAAQLELEELLSSLNI
ncbi:MAG TPA: ABC transporter ATP-binding protein, partial [Caldithrix abyssi]|nr:ABC transporter ATP-binding protein [Caldithrix abyssi]